MPENTAKSLYIHIPHNHKPRNVNDLHKEKHSGINKKIAVGITKALGTMWCAYIFMALALYGFPGFHATPPQYVQWLSQTFIQLVALSVLAVGQAVLGEHQELQATEQFNTTLKTYHDIEQMMLHLDAQDTKILEIEQHVLQILEQTQRRAKKV